MRKGGTNAAALTSVQSLSHVSMISYFIIYFNRPELQQKLEAEKVIGPDGWQLQQFAEGY